jgi:hypothetical protein
MLLLQLGIYTIIDMITAFKIEVVELRDPGLSEYMAATQYGTEKVEQPHIKSL